MEVDRIQPLDQLEGQHRTASRIESRQPMDSEIEFGKIELAQPTPGCRPDRDKHFVAVACGEIGDSDLPIYVDMDALRDMEAHARENKRVELGGVMLGRRHVDQDGRPYVVIVDSLRARHYEATKGSFKFTHDTWNQITRERNEFRPELEMVGWYHTHPGWGVFLSGMDLFISNHFFNRPLDVALVIDPCAGERGWFQWDQEEPGSTRQTNGFFLMTNRHRRKELNYFSEIFDRPDPRMLDPRFRQSAFDQDLTHEAEGNMVHLVDSRRPVFELAVASMLFLQLLAVLLIGWRMTERQVVDHAGEFTERLTVLESQLEENRQRRSTTIREQALADVLETIVSAETGQGGLVQKYSGVAEQNRLLSENLEGQLSRLEQTKKERDQLARELTVKDLDARKLEENLSRTRQTLAALKKQNGELKSQLEDGQTMESAKSGLAKPWLIYSLGSAGVLMIGIATGFLLSRILEHHRPGERPTSRRDDQIDRDKDRNRADVAFSQSAEASEISSTQG